MIREKETEAAYMDDFYLLYGIVVQKERRVQRSER